MTTSQKRVVCFGEVLLRLSAPGRTLLLSSDTLDAQFGGAEANVAIALACLGHGASMATVLPDTRLGDAAIEHLRRFGVRTGDVVRAPGRLGLYFLTSGAGLRPSEIVYDRAGSAFAAATDHCWDHLLAGADHFHLSGITPALGPVPARLALEGAAAARDRGVPVSFDGNYRGALWAAWDGDARALLTPIVEQADILFGNHRDIGLLLGTPFGGEGETRRREAADAAFARFPNLRTIASTQRHVEAGDHHRLAARIDTRDDSAQTDEIEVPGIVDRIGTGDAFAAGVLDALLRDEPIATAARQGLALACLKHSLPGDATTFTRAALNAFGLDGLDVRR